MRERTSYNRGIPAAIWERGLSRRGIQYPRLAGDCTDESMYACRTKAQARRLN